MTQVAHSFGILWYPYPLETNLRSVKHLVSILFWFTLLMYFILISFSFAFFSPFIPYIKFMACIIPMCRAHKQTNIALFLFHVCAFKVFNSSQTHWNLYYFYSSRFRYFCYSVNKNQFTWCIIYFCLHAHKQASFKPPLLYDTTAE